MEPTSTKRFHRSTSPSWFAAESITRTSGESDTTVEAEGVVAYEPIPLTECPYAGLKVDILDPEKIWASATIISVRKNLVGDESGTSANSASKKRSRDSGGEYEVTISYDGWGPEWDETLVYPNLRIVRHFTFSRQVKAFLDIQAPKQKYSSSAAPEPMIYWPCRVQVRMPDINNDVAAYFLELEESLYVEPYLPKDIGSSTNSASLPPSLRRIFPNCCHSKKQDDGRIVPGSWLPTRYLRQFRKFDFGMFSQHQLKSNFPLPGFISSYEEAMNDQTTPGTLPKRLFRKGSLVNDKFRVVDQNDSRNKYTGEFCEESNRLSTTAVNNSRPSPPLKSETCVAPTMKDSSLPPKLPPSIKIVETLYPKTTRRASGTNYEWFGVISTGGGNEVIVGKFPSQSAAHEAATLAIAKRTKDYRSETNTIKKEAYKASIAADCEKYKFEGIAKKGNHEVPNLIETRYVTITKNKAKGDKHPELAIKRNNREEKSEVRAPKAYLSTPNISQKTTLLDSNNAGPSNDVADEKDCERASKSASKKEWKTLSGIESTLSEAINTPPTSLPEAYKVCIPITNEGLLLQVGPCSELLNKVMPNFNCTFQGYRQYSDGRKGIPELKRLIHGIGDWIVEIDGQSTKNMTFEQAMGELQEKISEKRKIHISELHFTLVDCTKIISRLKATKPAEMIDLTLDEDDKICSISDDLKVTDVVRSDIKNNSSEAAPLKATDFNQTSPTKKNDDLQIPVNPSCVDLTHDYIQGINFQCIANYCKAVDSAINDTGNKKTETEDFNDCGIKQTFLEERGNRSDIGVINVTNFKSDVNSANTTEYEVENINVNNCFGKKSDMESEEIIELSSSDADNELKNSDLNLQEVEHDEARADEELVSTSDHNEFLIEEAPTKDFSTDGIENKFTSDADESQCSAFKVTQDDLIEMRKDATPLSFDDIQLPTIALPPILGRKVEIGMDIEEDTQNISLEAVVTAVENMFDPSVHTFSMQEWTIELIRHKAYLKKVSNGTEHPDVTSEKFSDESKLPYDSLSSTPSKSESVSSSFHTRKQRKPRKLLV